MVLKSIGLKKIGIKEIKNYRPDPLKAGLYGTSFITTGTIAKFAYGAGVTYDFTEIVSSIFNIIKQAYKSELFYKASWEIKSKILAKRIIQDPAIQKSITEATLAHIIYNIMQNNRNRQGNEKLAREILDEVIQHEMKEWGSATTL